MTLCRRLAFAWMILLLGALPTLAQTYAVTGTVRDDATRIPVAGAAVVVIDAETRDTLALAAETDSLGRYALEVAADVGVERPARAAGYTLEARGPNPITAATEQPLTLRYTTPGNRPERPRIEVYDLQGRRVTADQPLARGVYFYRLRFATGYVTPAGSVILLDRRALPLEIRQTVGAVSAEQAGWAGAAGRQAAGKQASQLGVVIVASKPFYRLRELPRTLEADGANTIDIALTPANPLQQADAVTYDVTYKPEAVVVEGAAREALVEADTVRQLYRFDAEALAASGTELEVGQVMLVEGVALRRITGLRDEGAHLVVETAAASLNHAIQDGEIGWEHTLGFDPENFPDVTAAAGKAIHSGGGPIKLTYKAGEYTYTIELKPMSADSVEVKAEVTKTVGGLKARLTGLARLRPIRTKAAATYTDGELQSLDVDTDDQEILIKLDIAAAGAGISENDIGFQVPTAVFRYVFMAGPLPIVTDFKLQFVFRMKVDPNASATAQTTLRYASDTGLEYKGTELAVKNVTTSVKSDGATADAASTFVPVDLQFGVALPRIEMSVLGLPLITYLRTGFFIGSTLTFGPVCKTGFWRVTIDAGADLKVFTDKVIPVFNAQVWERKEEEKSGGCPPAASLDAAGYGPRPLAFIPHGG